MATSPGDGGPLGQPWGLHAACEALWQQE